MTALLEQTSTHGTKSVSTHRRLPVDDGTTANVQSVTGETVQLFYYDATTGVLTQDAGQAAGTVVVFNLTNKNVLNALGSTVGCYGDTSFSFGTGTILTTLAPFRGILAEQAEFNGVNNLKAGQNIAIAVTAGFRNGQYCLDHEHGVGYGIKATTGTSDTGAYKVLSPGGGSSVPENVNVAKIGGVAVSTNTGTVDAGTQRVTLASNDPAVTSLAILDDWDESDRAKVNPIVGQAGIAAGEGATSATTTRVVTALVAKTFADSTATATTSSGTVLASNASRKMGTSIQNTSTSIGVFLNVTDAAVVNQGLYLGPNGSFVMDENQFTTGAITGITASGSAVLSVMEAT